MEVWKIIFLSKWVICRFHVNLPGCMYYVLSGGFKYFLCSSPKIGEMESNLTSIFSQMGWFNHRLDDIWVTVTPLKFNI